MIIHYLTPPWENIGDKLIYLGCRYLMETKYPTAYHSPLFLNPNQSSTVPSPITETNIGVLCGTPWLWHGCEHSAKYDNLISILPSLQRKIALGLGSCYSLGWDIAKVLDYSDTAFLKSFWRQFDKITVRDVLAYQIMQALGIHCSLCLCPSWWAATYLGLSNRWSANNRSKTLIIVQDVTSGVSKEIVNQEEWTTKYKGIISSTNPPLTIVAIEKCDYVYAIETLGVECKLHQQRDPYADDWYTVLTYLRVIQASDVVISSRVHGIIPALTFGKEAYILPMDSRYLTAELAGGTNL